MVVPFETPATGSASGCAQGVDAALISDIMANPAGFYVNVHNSAFPAVRFAVSSASKRDSTAGGGRRPAAR